MAVGTDSAELKKLLRSNECEFVSLGYNCDVAQLLRYSNLRKKAYPFDWCITPIDSVVRLVENNFYGFLDSGSLDFSEPHRALFFEESKHHIVEADKIVVTAKCSHYNMVFPHDFSDASQEVYEEVVQKYLSRIERFLDLMKSERFVVFVFNPKGDSSGRQIDIFNEMLTLKYPDLNYRIYNIGLLKSVLNESLVKKVSIFIGRKKQQLVKPVVRFFNK